MTDLRYWIGFNRVPGIGPAKVRLLLDHFGDLEQAWRAAPAELRRAGLDRRSVDSLLKTRSSYDAERDLRQLERIGARVLTWDDDAYPVRLREIPHPPPVLYVKGTLVETDQWALAVVGTRRATAYGKEAARVFAGELAASGITIVSGMALGIDAAAHKAAIDAGGRTIAVLGNGIDVVYPPEHRKLSEQIVQHGALVCDYPLGTKPDAGNFPPRNRIISGLSLAVLVVEAGERSGALITADFAAEQGRDVFAMPGHVFARSSAGSNRLLRDGALVALKAQDILEELNMTMVTQHIEARAAIPPQDETESRLLALLSSEAVHIDEISRQTGLPISQVSSALAMMELKGMVRQTGGMNYIVAREPRAPYRVE
jgi:DNA processing protein